MSIQAILPLIVTKPWLCRSSNLTSGTLKAQNISSHCLQGCWISSEAVQSSSRTAILCLVLVIYPHFTRKVTRVRPSFTQMCLQPWLNESYATVTHISQVMQLWSLYPFIIFPIVYYIHAVFLCKLLKEVMDCTCLAHIYNMTRTNILLYIITKINK